MVRRDGALVEVSWGEAIAAAADAIRSATAAVAERGRRDRRRGAHERGPVPLGPAPEGGGSAPTTWTPSWATASTPPSSPRCRARRSTTRHIARVVLVLAGDLEAELPVLFLRLRQAAAREVHGARRARRRRAPASREVSHASVRVRPGDAPDRSRRSSATPRPRTTARRAPRGRGLRRRTSSTRARAAHPGRRRRPRGRASGVRTSPSRAAVIEEAIRRLARALPKARFLVALRRGNVAGAIDLGLAPGCCRGASRSTTGGPGSLTAGGRTSRARP